MTRWVVVERFCVRKQSVVDATPRPHRYESPSSIARASTRPRFGRAMDDGYFPHRARFVDARDARSGPPRRDATRRERDRSSHRAIDLIARHRVSVLAHAPSRARVDAGKYLASSPARAKSADASSRSTRARAMFDRSSLSMFTRAFRSSLSMFTRAFRSCLSMMDARRSNAH